MHGFVQLFQKIHCSLAAVVDRRQIQLDLRLRSGGAQDDAALLAQRQDDDVGLRQIDGFLRPGRQVALEAASPRPRFSGTPEQVADGLQAWFDGYAADGFIIQGGTPDTFPRFVDQVVPVLQARGLFRTDYPGTTLRDSLGLDEPKNQFTQQ